ncbi:hypothetical protein Angca_001928 [Angiostrongylus cantonensis]|nr:hypothetical protein Angca_001928 [Angiostrongylus cantonensis]
MNQSHLSPTGYACVECNASSPKFPTAEELEIHIASDHLNYCPYECERCRFAKFPTEYALISHCKNDHELKEFFVSYLLISHVSNYGSNFTSTSNPSSALAELSPMDFASDAMSSGMDFAALIGEGEELIRKVSYVVSSDECYVCSFFSDECELSFFFQPKDAVICQICGLKVSNQRSSLVYHANTKHIKLNLYQCAVCHKTWQTIAKSDVLKHVKAIHNGDESMIIDNRKRLGYQLRMFTARCFPPKPNNKARPLTAGCSPPRPGISSADGDFSNIHSESASQILQSFIVSGGNSAVNAPKEEPDMDHDEGEHEDGGDGLDEVDHGYGDGRAMQAALACMVAQQQQQQQQQQQKQQQPQQQMF